MNSKKEQLTDLLKRLKSLHNKDAITSDEFRTLRSEAYREFELQPDDLGAEDISIPSDWLQKLVAWLILFSVGITVYMTVLRSDDSESLPQPISDPPVSTTTTTSTTTSTTTLAISIPSQNPLSNSFTPPLPLITRDLPQGAITVLPSSSIRFIQSVLNNNGYFLGSADGLWGARSEAALVNFQSESGISRSNTLDKIFWIQVFSAQRNHPSLLADESKIGLNDAVIPSSAVLFQTSSDTDMQITAERYVLPFHTSLDDVALWFLARDLVGVDAKNWVMPKWDESLNMQTQNQNDPEESITFTLLNGDATTTVTILDAGVGRVDLVLTFE